MAAITTATVFDYWMVQLIATRPVFFFHSPTGNQVNIYLFADLNIIYIYFVGLMCPANTRRGHGFSLCARSTLFNFLRPQKERRASLALFFLPRGQGGLPRGETPAARPTPPHWRSGGLDLWDWGSENVGMRIIYLLYDMYLGYIFLLIIN